MDIVALYKKKLFHQVVICASLCVDDVDYLCLCLSLVGLGRQRAAVVLLRAKAETAMDPPFKICLLSFLYQITGIPEFAVESEYWQSLGDFDEMVYHGLKPIPRCPDKPPGDCAMNFLEKGAFFHPYSYSFTSVDDKRAALNIAHSKNGESLLLQIIADCGSTTHVARALKSGEMRSVFKKSEKNVDHVDAVADPHKNFIEGLNLVESLSALAGYYHLLQNSSKALHYCTRTIHLINTIRMHCEFSNLRGISDYEKETMVMIASQHLPLTAEEAFVEGLLNELMNPEMPKKSAELDSFDQEKSPGSHTVSRATSLRQSLFFASCGNIHRLMAQRSCISLTFMRQGKHYRGKIYTRSDALEMARKYVLSSALQPTDNPFLYLYYDRVIWCLLLCGGIDIRVLLLFITIRNYYSHQSFFSLVENDPEDPSMIWPKFKINHWSEILEKTFDMCTEIIGRVSEGPGLLSPTTIDCEANLVVLKRYIHEPHHLQLNELHQPDISDISSQTSVSDTEFSNLMSSSQEIVEIWSSTFRKYEGAIPNEIRSVAKFFNI
ncbi:hypothetical protein JCM33374_g4245 [Metschnikowia sp. JCM 33374]|nr:hypothetical protein JCM33374_g4245 [Metschnikowia sp. JCM 33374]